MSRSDSAWRWSTILVLRSEADRYARGHHIGPVVVRDVLAPPQRSVDPATGEVTPAGWYAGASSGDVPGIVGALAELRGHRRGLRVYVATLTGSTVAEWRAQLPAVAAGVRDARVGWDLPRTIAITRARSATIEDDILQRWPGVRVVWLGAAKAERADSAQLAEVAQDVGASE